jgi:hypothetical protein
MNVNVLDQNSKNGVRMNVVARIFPYQKYGKKFDLVANHGPENKQREILLCNGGVGENGWLTIKAVPTATCPDFHKRVASLFKIGDTVELSGVIEEREVNDVNNGVNYIRTLKVINLNRIKVVDKTTEKKATGQVQGVIEDVSLIDNTLVVNTSNEGSKYQNKVHLMLENNDDCQFIIDELKIGDIVKVEVEHFNKAIKDKDDKVIDRVNCLVVHKCLGYRKME